MQVMHTRQFTGEAWLAPDNNGGRLSLTWLTVRGVVQVRLADEKKRKRQHQYHLKKMKKRSEFDEQLRASTGVRGFVALYEVLGLPTNKLAKEKQIKVRATVLQRQESAGHIWNARLLGWGVSMSKKEKNMAR